uniref:Uncharacterized protein n=1 Tax=Ditylenchus dipsaci TaxID=166011 RepID=A0A915D3N9_9BILA
MESSHRHRIQETIGKLKLQDDQSWKLTRQWVLWHMDGNDDGWNSLDERVKQVVQVDSIHQFWASMLMCKTSASSSQQWIFLL